MRVIVGEADRGPVYSAALLVGALAVLTFTVATGYPLRQVLPLVLLVVIAAAGYRLLLRWEALLGLLILVILFIPIRRYTMPGNLPFELEPYRLVVAMIAVAWGTSLLIDRRVRLRRSGLEGPLLLFVFAALASVLVNAQRVAATDVQAHVVKKLMFFASFLVVFYLVASLVRRRQSIDVLLKFLTGGGAIVAVLAVIENRYSYNVFNGLQGIVPLVELSEVPDAPQRSVRLRAYASAEHPIALGAALVTLLPGSIYLARTAGHKWWIASILLVLGTLATVSRTAVLMLMALLLAFLWLRPRSTALFLPALIPILVIVHFALPATLGSIKNSFFPPGGLIEEQQSSVGTRGQGRIADIQPALEEVAREPLLGQGFGTRPVTDNLYGSLEILDNQWLGILLETGVIGTFAWTWLFLRFLPRSGRAAKEDPSPRGLLLAAITAAVFAYAIGMFTYDAFAFTQGVFIFFILLGFGCSVLVSRSWQPAKAK